MAERRPIVSVAGALQELPTGDTLPGGGAGATIQQYNLMSCFPFVIGATVPTAVRTQTSTLHTATLCRVFPFWLPAAITVNQVLMQTVAAGTANIQIAIFDSAGTRLWTSGNQNTVAGNMLVTASLPLVLQAGQYYFATTIGTTAVNTTAVYQTAPLFTAATVPRWGTVACTGGVMPASITPSAITETVGPFMTYVELSNWTT